MSGIASSLVSPPRYRNQVPPRPRSEAKRARIVDTAMRHFAEQGYHANAIGWGRRWLRGEQGSEP